ncbi:beta carbonic anhydrase 1 [Aplysia californica]|uniref:Carbonic anhydrase n=1 Tax=Aplysia californica TaxID=6500 RepID=A0ABM0K0W5_APLCA|nr:beta carbonic anhydrase 1 [Aplysia californica]XP_035827706.1 beta carbonic anhydrase 1 [Aplysia californica]
MEKMLRNILKYNGAGKAKFLADMDNLASNIIKPTTVFFSCIDSRVLAANFTRPDSGETFFVQNAGNMVPHFQSIVSGQMSTEGAALELGCLSKGIRSVVVCGHSDCKAVHALYDMRSVCDHTKYHPDSPLMSWVAFHGKNTVKKFSDSQNTSTGPNTFTFSIGGKEVKAIIDSENQFDVQDKLSQLHCLQQASHVSSYPFLHSLIQSGELTVNALWFDVQSGYVYMFSPKDERFVIVTEENLDTLLSIITK